MGLVAALPLDLDPGEWPELTLAAATVFLEAESEPEIGQLAVAWVIRNLMDAGGVSARFAILSRDGRAQGDGKPFETFSVWNDDYVTTSRQRLATAGATPWERAWRCACAAYWKLLPDPTGGARFYLNVELTKKIRGGTLPAWFDPKRVTVTINAHTFLRG